MGLTIVSPADKCAACGKFRRAHSKSGNCPTGKAGKGGVYSAFLETKFTRHVIESVVAKHDIKVGDIYLDAKADSLGGYLVKDVHLNATGDYVTVQKVTPLGKDGPLLKVLAKRMAQETHYGPCVAPEWWPKPEMQKLVRKFKTAT